MTTISIPGNAVLSMAANIYAILKTELSLDLRGGVMRYLVCIVLVYCFSACAGDSAIKPAALLQPSSEAIQEVIAQRHMLAQSGVRVNQPKYWEYVNDQYLLIVSRDQNYLVELSRSCSRLKETFSVATEKGYMSLYDVPGSEKKGMGAKREFEPGGVPNVTVRAKLDAVAGCKIDSIYALDEQQNIDIALLRGDVAELENSG